MPSCWSDTRLLFFSVGAALPSSPATLMSLLHNTCRGSHAIGWDHRIECTACSQSRLSPCLVAHELQGRAMHLYDTVLRTRLPSSPATFVVLAAQDLQVQQNWRSALGQNKAAESRADDCKLRVHQTVLRLPHPLNTLSDKAYAEGPPQIQHPIGSRSQSKHAGSSPQPQQVRWCACNTSLYPAA